LKKLFESIHKDIVGDYDSSEWGYHIDKNLSSLPNLGDKLIVIFGVPEDRGGLENLGSKSAINNIRKEFYRLKCWHPKIKIADLGNLKVGKTKEETYENMSVVLQELKKLRIVSIVIGGSHDLTLGQVMVSKSENNKINLTVVDEKINWMSENKTDFIASENFLNHLFLHYRSNLDLYAHIAYQSYFVLPESLDYIAKNNFQAYRLGFIKNYLSELEPILRDSDLLSFDIAAIMQADAKANKNLSPNGITGEQACQLFRYAGLSDKLYSIGIYEVNPEFDDNNQTALLVAQMLWYFIDGFLNRKVELPTLDQKNFMKFVVSIKSDDQELIFWKHRHTEKWWVEVPASNESILIACSYRDYQIACNEELPDKWLNAFKRYN